MISTEGFSSVDPEASYPMAGSFVAFLLDEYGRSAFKDFARSSEWQDPPG